MTTNHLYNCLSCGRQFNPKVLKKCPVCQTPHLASEAPQTAATPTSNLVSNSNVPSPGNVSSSPQVQAWSSLKSTYANAAATSAKTVDSYGSAIQIVGYILAVLTFIGFTFVWGPDNDSKFLGFILGIVVGGLTAWGYQVLGALYRMVANYVLFRTSK
jgi:hypothetical protein